jgi:hypothetical protein
MGVKKLLAKIVDNRPNKAYENTLKKQKIHLAKLKFRKSRVTRQIRVSDKYYQYLKCSARKSEMTISKFMDKIGGVVFSNKRRTVKKKCIQCNFVNKIDVHIGIPTCSRSELRKNV